MCVSRKCECIKMRMCCFEIFEQYFNYNIIADFFIFDGVETIAYCEKVKEMTF